MGDAQKKKEYSFQKHLWLKEHIWMHFNFIIFSVIYFLIDVANLCNWSNLFF